MRVLAAATFAIAAAASALGGVGLVVVPHDHPAGAGPGRDHPLTAYRFPLLLIGDIPGVPRAEELAHHIPEVHRAHLRALLGPGGPSIEPLHPLAELAAGAFLALLVIAVPRLPRPTRRPLAEVPIPTLVTAQWKSPLRSPPPRVRVFATA